ncbi:hypothetical protein ATCC90586_009148 [Pythium insidiosum]|nr:hypothetical protein ATCC90586_009148 [Pythium insidiosum]
MHVVSDDGREVIAVDEALSSLHDVSSTIDLSRVQHLNVSFNALTDVRGLETAAELRNLNLSHNALSETLSLHAVAPTWSQLRRLRVSSNQLRDLSWISALKTLEELWVNDNQLESSQLPQLSALQSLQTLILHPNPCTTPVNYVASYQMTAEDFMRAFPVQEFIPVSLDGNQREHDHSESDASETRLADKTPDPVAVEGMASTTTTPDDSNGAAPVEVQQPTEPHDREVDALERPHEAAPASLEKDQGMTGLSAIASAVLGLSSLEGGLFSKKKKKKHNPTTTASSTSKAKTLSKTAASESSDTKTLSKTAASESSDSIAQPVNDLATFHQEPRSILYNSSSTTAIQIRADGSAIAKWPNGSVAISVDRERDGFRAYAAHKDGQVALSLDADGVGFINYYPSGRMMLSTSSSGDGLLFSADGAIVRQWDATLHLRDERWETTDRLGDEPDGALLVKLSDALAVRLQLVDRQQSMRPSALQLDVYFSCNGVRHVLRNWLNSSDPSDHTDACAAVFGPLSVGKSSKKLADLPPRSHQATLHDIRAAVAKLDTSM